MDTPYGNAKKSERIHSNCPSYGSAPTKSVTPFTKSSRSLCARVKVKVKIKSNITKQQLLCQIRQVLTTNEYETFKQTVKLLHSLKDTNDIQRFKLHIARPLIQLFGVNNKSHLLPLLLSLIPPVYKKCYQDMIMRAKCVIVINQPPMFGKRRNRNHNINVHVSHNCGTGDNRIQNKDIDVDMNANERVGVDNNNNNGKREDNNVNYFDGIDDVMFTQIIKHENELDGFDEFDDNEMVECLKRAEERIKRKNNIKQELQEKKLELNQLETEVHNLEQRLRDFS